MRNSYKFLLLSFIFCTNILLASTQNESTLIKPIVTSSSKIVVDADITITESLNPFNTCSGSAAPPKYY